MVHFQYFSFLSHIKSILKFPRDAKEMEGKCDVIPSIEALLRLFKMEQQQYNFNKLAGTCYMIYANTNI